MRTSCARSSIIHTEISRENDPKDFSHSVRKNRIKHGHEQGFSSEPLSFLLTDFRVTKFH
jgi:hypothetical protein